MIYQTTNILIERWSDLENAESWLIKKTLVAIEMFMFKVLEYGSVFLRGIL